MKVTNGSATASGFMMAAITQAALAQPVPQPTAAVALDVVTITANKREERLQEVPATATVVQAQQLDQQNINSIEGLARAVPTFDASAAGLRIRGFGGISFSLTAESSVGILVDGVSLAGAADFPPNLFDVERVEVLEGPQGTLFGKNSSAGIINVVTRAPNTRAFEGLARADLQSRDGKTAQVALNVPVSDALAFRVAGSMVDDPRSTHNLIDNTWDRPHKMNGRLRMLWRATDAITVNLSTDESVTTLRGGSRWTVYQSTPGSVLTKVLTACGVTVQPDNVEDCGNPSQNGNKTRVGGQSAQVDWVLGDYTLTSVSAVRNVKNEIPNADYDDVNLRAPNYVQPELKTYHNVSQELRVASPNYGWGNFVAGAYYFKGRIHQDLTGIFTLPTFTLGQNNQVAGENTSTALFGQGTYKLTKALSMNLGARIGHEEASTTRTGTVIPGAVGAVVKQKLIPVEGATTDDYISWRAGAQYDFDASHMGYVGYTRGYKGPAVNHNATNPAVPPIVRPEIPAMVEAGLKSLFLDGRFAVNVSAYTTKIKDYQATVWDPTSLAFVFSNAPQLDSHGATVVFYGKPSSALTVNGGAAYMIAKLGPGFLVQCAMGSPAGCTRDASGDQAGGAPKVRATLAMDYTFPVGSLRGSLGGDVVYTSQKLFDRTDPAVNLPATTIVGARIGIRSADNRSGVAFYARNLFDKFSPTYRIGNLAAFATGDTHSYTQFLGPESRRVLGVSADVEF